MALSNGEQASDKVLNAHAHICNHMFNFVNSIMLDSAIQLGIPDVIKNHGRPITLSELVDALPINKAKAHAVYRLMRMLVHSGFFLKQKILSESRNEEEAYLLAPSSRFLLKDEPLSLRTLFLAMGDPIFVNPWYHVTQWFQNDDSTPFESANGKTIWEYSGQEPELFGFFNDAMASDSRFLTDVVIKECKDVFGGLNSLVDVGGGTGAVGNAIVNANPHLHCTVFDLPHVVANLEGSKNLSFVGGSMLESIPPADAVLLKSILHNWSDEECLKILKLCKEAIPSREKGGKVIIIDMVVDDEMQKEDYKSLETKLFFDLMMMVSTTGKERTQKEWEGLFKGSGFSDFKITHLLGLRSLIEVYP